MPSVLVELGFLTNKKEGAYLNSKKGQKEMSETIAKGIINYRDNLLSSVFKTEKITADLAQKKIAEKTNKKQEGIIFKIQLLASSKSKLIRKNHFKNLKIFQNQKKAKFISTYGNEYLQKAKILKLKQKSRFRFIHSSF